MKANEGALDLYARRTHGPVFMRVRDAANVLLEFSLVSRLSSDPGVVNHPARTSPG